MREILLNVEKVVILISNFHLYKLEGQQKLTMWIIKNLIKNNIKVMVITNDPNVVCSKTIAINNYLTICSIPGAVSYTTFIRNILIIRSIIRNFMPEIIHCHGLPMVILGTLLGYGLKLPVVSTLYDLGQIFRFNESGIQSTSDFFSYVINNVIPKLAYFFLFFVDHIFCSSEFIKKYLVNYHIVSTKISIIPYGLESEWRKAKKKKNNEKIFNVLFWGDAKYERGISNYLAIIPSLVKKYPKIKFNLAIRYWDEKYYRLYSKMKKKHPILSINSSSFKHVSEVVQKADLIILPYVSTTIYPPLTLVESLVIGIPVITTNVEANRELIEDNKNGIIVEPNNLNELLNSIEMVVDDYAPFLKRSKYARKFILNRYDDEKNIKNIITVYDYVISNRH